MVMTGTTTLMNNQQAAGMMAGNGMMMGDMSGLQMPMGMGGMQPMPGMAHPGASEMNTGSYPSAGPVPQQSREISDNVYPLQEVLHQQEAPGQSNPASAPQANAPTYHTPVCNTIPLFPHLR